MSTESLEPSAGSPPRRARSIRASPARQTVESDEDELIRKLYDWPEEAANHVARLTARQRKIMELVLAGHSSKCTGRWVGRTAVS
jgi:hypothetical protein